MDTDLEAIELNLKQLVEAIAEAVLFAYSHQDLAEALILRDEINRLPTSLVTEVLNQVMLKLIQVNPDICRWFILDVFLREADPEGRADVAERINLLMADLRKN
jgi:hypothetical protein